MINNDMGFRKCLIVCFLLVVPFFLSAQAEKHFPKSDRLVNDYSGMLSAKEREVLELRLEAFDDTTSNQIAIVITPTLYGEEIMDLGTRIAHGWGIGQDSLDNGVLILIKSKTAEEPDGDVAILPGYGLEGVLPDALCKHITDEMVLPLSKGCYYDALVVALDVIEPACTGEYKYGGSEGELEKEDTVKVVIFLLIILALVIY